VDVPESMVAGLTSWKASARLGEPAGEPVPLRLRELAPSATPATRTFRARYAAAGSASRSEWRMGMTAEVQLQQPGHSGS
jgi:multidrug efflux pump subunit AcrA (membrane-fusion protein)